MRAMLAAGRSPYLWATEGTIYGRFGFGLASLTAEIDLARERSAFYAPFSTFGHVRLVSLGTAEELLAPIYERVAVETPGMFERSSAWWQTCTLADPEWRRRGNGDLQCAVLEHEGRATAYALYRINPAFQRGIQTGSVAAIEVVAASPEATRGIWRYLLDIDWMARVKADLLPVDYPLLLLMVEPRRLDFTLRDGLWVRLVQTGGQTMPAIAAESLRPRPQRAAPQFTASDFANSDFARLDSSS